MEHLLQKSKCSIFHNIFKYMIVQRCQKKLLRSEGLTESSDSVRSVNTGIERVAGLRFTVAGVTVLSH